jgi:Fe-S oxidoreductase
MANTIELQAKYTTDCIECPYAKEIHHAILESRLFTLKYTPDKHYIIATCIGCGTQLKMVSAKYAESDIIEL